MKKDNLPLVNENDSIKKVINVISSGKCGLAVVETKKNIRGVISDGDIRRAMEFNEINFFKLRAKDIMTHKPQTVYEPTKIKFAADLMFSKKINIKIDKNEKEQLTGIVQSYDIGI